MTKCVALFSAALLAVSLTPRASAAADTQTLTGQLVDLAYYSLNKDAVGNKHIYGVVGAQCTAREGFPVGLLTSDGKVYEIHGGLAANMNAKLVPQMAHTVTITGEVAEKDDIKTITANDLKVSAKWQVGKERSSGRGQVSAGGDMDDVKQKDAGGLHVPPLGRRDLMKLGAGVVMTSMSAPRLFAQGQGQARRGPTRPSDYPLISTHAGFKYTANRLSGNGPMDAISQQIATFTTGFSEKMLTPAAVAGLNKIVLDCMVALIGSFGSEIGQICARLAKLSPPGELKATISGYGVVAEPVAAAFANCYPRQTGRLQRRRSTARRPCERRHPRYSRHRRGGEGHRSAGDDSHRAGVRVPELRAPHRAARPARPRRRR